VKDHKRDLPFIGLALFYIIVAPAAAFSQSTDKKPPQVWKVKIEGNKTFSDIRLKSQIATDGYSFLEKLEFWHRKEHKLNIITVKKDVIRIQDFYHRQGFPAAKVHYRIENGGKKWKKIVTFIIDEKAPIRISAISFHFLNNKRYEKKVKESHKMAKARRESFYQVEKRYVTAQKAAVSSHYQQVLKDMGFAYANVKIDAKVDTSRLKAQLTINANLGPKTYIHHISVTGDSTVSDHYVIRQSGLHKGELYSPKALRRAQQLIYNHPLFQFVTITIPQQPEDSTLNLAMRVREKPLHTLKTAVGVGTRDYVRGKVSWVNRNAFGDAHKFSATAKASFI
jgi:outer membrane protein assembly factor BamA